MTMNEGHSTPGSGESAFIDRNEKGSKSTKIVRFHHSSQNCEGMDFEDDEADSPKKGRPVFGNFMKQMIHALNSPTGIQQREHSRGNNKRGHTRNESHTLTEYPFSMINLREDIQQDSSPEKSPLLGRNRATYGVYDEPSKDFHPLLKSTKRSENFVSESSSCREDIKRSMATRIAACFLMDYEAGRVATLPSTLDLIKEEQLDLYQTYYSWQWRCVVNGAILLLFLAHTQDMLKTAILHTIAIVVLAIDIHIREGMYGAVDLHDDNKHPDRKLVRPMVAVLSLLGLEAWMWYFISPSKVGSYATPIFSSIFKPIVFFYVSAKARESLQAIFRIGQIVIRVIMIEFVLILIFAAFAQGLFGQRFEDFWTLPSSWLILFQLSTTVNNPSLWMPIYATNPNYSIFFVVFLVTCVFYYHSLVLSVVFQTYIQAVTDIHARAASDRDDALRLAFLALLKDNDSDRIRTSSIRKCLHLVRPHYNSLKLNALLEIVDPSNQNGIDYPTFRNRIRLALNSSVRTARTASPLAMGVEVLAVFVAVANFLYVTGKTFDRGQAFWDIPYDYVGFLITFLGFLELTIRFNPLKIPNFAPITRLDVFFDGMAAVAAFVSCYGIVQYAIIGEQDMIENGETLDYLQLGRAIDMIRVMRFSAIFRDIVRRSSDVFPALAGPLMLVLSVIHIFVYVGILLWSGSIDVDVLMEQEDLTPFYCLNNFNSYTEGLITMFNVAVVNDWHAIAEIYLYADRHSSDWIVYSFFVSALCFMVFLMINVIIAFFVETFVTKTNEPPDDEQHDAAEEKASNRFRIQNSENTNVRRVQSTENFTFGSFEEESSEIDLDADVSMKSAASSARASFDIYEREGFDNIMRTVAGNADDEQEAFARSVCNYLERFESLTSGREKVGYMVCCQQSLNRFGNRRFQTLSRNFVNDCTLHQVVSDMHSELLAQKNSERCLVRTFSEQDDELSSRQLEIAATLIRHQPAATLFSSRIRTSKGTE